MNILKTAASMFLAWLVAQVSTTVVVGAASTWLLSPDSSADLKLHLLVTAIALAGVFSLGAAVMYMLNVGMWLATLVPGLLVTSALVGVLSEPFLSSRSNEQLAIVAILGSVSLLAAFASSFTYSRTRRALGH